MTPLGDFRVVPAGAVLLSEATPDQLRGQLCRATGHLVLDVVPDDPPPLPGGLPPGSTELRHVTVVLHRETGTILVLGHPSEAGQDDDHDCDRMGCGSVDHVVARWAP